MNILLLEDNPAITNAYQIIISKMGHSIDAAARPSLAMNATKHYDLILLDLMMPELSGEDLVQKIASHYPDSKIVVLTNMGSGFDAGRLDEIGVDQILLKSSVGPNELRELIDQYDR